MHYTKNFMLLTLLSFSLSVSALEELQTKQIITKLRYVSTSGKITYYQKNSGELQMATNYNFANLLKLKPNTHYAVRATPTQSRVIITADEYFHTKLNGNKNLPIYSAKLGRSDPPRKIGSGVSPNLHLEDSWVSYYDKRKLTLNFVAFNENIKSKEVKVKVGPNKYFTPQTYMITPNDIVYTDVNERGIYGAFLYSFIEQKFKLIYKAKQPGHKLNLCRIKDKLVIGEFPLLQSGSGSTIVSLDLFKSLKINNYKTHYSSSLPDIGNMICKDDSIYFIKSLKINNKINSSTTEVASINIKNSELKILSDIQFATHLIEINNIIVTPFRGKYYIVKGANNLKDDAIKDEGKKEEK